jgi:hypothetical protein
VGASAALLAATTLAACAERAEQEEGGGAAVAVTVGTPVEMISPASEASGEPHLALGEDGLILSWLEQVPGGEAHALRMSVLSQGAWSEPATVAEREDFFVNWADFPSVVPVAPGELAAHWLQRGGSGTYDYGVRIARSHDGGRSWSEPWTPHEDGTATEHGFVSVFPVEEGWGLVWLDGRNYAEGSHGGEPSNEMTLRFRSAGGEGGPGAETLLDGRICDCCQTDAALTSRGPLVVYRDRSPDEIRDIAVTRLVDGAWTEGVPVHRDGWEIGGCPVNGPAVAARGERVVVAWFTGAGDLPRVHAAFSGDAGASFSEPVRIDGGNPSGRVDVELLPDGSALVAWVERTGEGGAEVRVRSAREGEPAGTPTTVARASEARASGFPQMVTMDDGSLVFAWTDVTETGSRIRVARAEVNGR